MGEKQERWLYIEAAVNPEKPTQGFVDLTSFITLFVHKLARNSIRIKLNKTSKTRSKIIEIYLDEWCYEVVVEDELSDILKLSTWPVILQEKHITSGLCAVSRVLVKHSKCAVTRKLLGFRDACLMACSGPSVWTSFCEQHLPNYLQELIENSCNYNEIIYRIPPIISRFEYHLGLPVRMHNAYKLATTHVNGDGTISRSLDLEHTYSEGLCMTLVDVIVYPCFQLLFQWGPHLKNPEYLPKICTWFDTMKSQLPIVRFGLPSVNNVGKKMLHESFVRKGFYASENRSKKATFTKQADVEKGLRCVKNHDIANGFLPYGFDVKFHWDQVPLQVNPIGGSIPNTRANRKSQQLENIVKAVLKLKSSQSRIVDFCSGSGHVGLLLAYLLPTAEVILVENKERSLQRAQQTIQQLNLSNVTIAQTNISYFSGSFDIGVCLHACGSATDIMMETCIKAKAHFVCCPCCYGGILKGAFTYPRSEKSRKMFGDMEKYYFNVAHAADQTHDDDNKKTEQGYLCMDVVDTDRKMYAESEGYEVFLGKLQPVSCTKKNNLLVGICKSKR